jgi:hypothetical protein
VQAADQRRSDRVTSPPRTFRRGDVRAAQDLREGDVRRAAPARAAAGTGLATDRGMPSLLRSPWITHLSTLVAGALAVAIIFRPTRTIPPEPAPQKLEAPVRLPPLARDALHGRMLRHGQQLGALFVDAVLLNRAEVARLAGEIYDEPRLARPLAGDALEGQLPDRFFQLQDELRAGAKRLVAAAAVDAPATKLADELGAFTKTCVACHDAYLHDEPPRAAPSPPSAATP